MDNETNKVLTAQEQLRGLVGHEGWSVARGKLESKILELQQTARYADQLDKNDKDGLLLSMKSDKAAAEILFDWLQEIEGEAAASLENNRLVDKSYIYKV